MSEKEHPKKEAKQSETAGKNGNHAKSEAAGAKAAPQAHANAAPIVKGRDWVDAQGAKVVETATGFKGWIKKILRFDNPPVQETEIVKTPFFMAGHLTDGTALNVARRGVEVTEPSISLLRAFYRSTIGTILHPVKSFMHPIETLKNPIRAITSGVKLAVEAARVPLRVIDDAVERGIRKATRQATLKIARIPAIGPLIEKSADFVTSIASKISGAVRGAMEWLTSPADVIHEAVAPC